MDRYYDLILGLIPLALLGISAILFLGGIDLTMAVPVGASVSVALIGHAMFVSPPVDNLPTPVDAEPTPHFEAAD